ncbi:uncharacterized protein LOC108099299 [Drosophila ficusphila]|uniref:uncharacterized protein LOC108099299 n=1 Tax=Drosophila ficusphila TaxID=30025 RepID=UPI0007E74E64|nr:uncharacterized protein LOC108099299 [Drosophila ficusphila]
MSQSEKRMRQLELNTAGEKITMIPSISRVVLLLCILGCVSASQDVKSKNCQARGEYCQIDTDCCSRKCLTYQNKCAPFSMNEIYDVVKEPVKPIKPNDQVQIVGLPNESEPSNDVFVVDSKADFESAAECQPVGGPCDRADECCNLRCLTYMHRCVT